MNKTKIEWSDYTVNPIRAKFAETATRWGRREAREAKGGVK